MAIGAKLKKLRKAAGYSQREMGAHLGLTGSSYNKNEKGLTFPNINTLRRLSETFAVSMDWLLFEKGPAHRKDLEKGSGASRGESGAEQSKSSTIETKPEVRELLDCMARVPLLYHEILVHFQRFKVDNRDLLEVSSSPDTPGE